MFLDLGKKLSGVSSFNVKRAKHAKRTPDDLSSQEVIFSSEEQFKISTYLVVSDLDDGSSDQDVSQSGINVCLSAQSSDSLE